MHGLMIGMTPRHCRAARAWMGWSQAALAELADVATTTIGSYEGGKGKRTATVEAIERVFSEWGMVFLEIGVVRPVPKDPTRQRVPSALTSISPERGKDK